VDAFHEGEEVQFRWVDNVVREAAMPGLAERLLDNGAHTFLLMSAEEPGTFVAAERDEAWRRAMLEEMKSIEDNCTWELVDPPVGCRPIRLKWVYKVKRDERGAVVKHKARPVAREFVQREGVDFEEVFAPVVRMESVRLLLALAAAKDWLSQWRLGGGCLRQATTRIRAGGPGAEGAAASEGAVWTAPSSARLECQARRHHDGAWIHTVRQRACSVHPTTGEGAPHCRGVRR